MPWDVLGTGAGGSGHVADHSFMRPMSDDVYFEASAGEVRLNLNCNSGSPTATNPGASLLSPADRREKSSGNYRPKDLDSVAVGDEDPIASDTFDQQEYRKWVAPMTMPAVSAASATY